MALPPNPPQAQASLQRVDRLRKALSGGPQQSMTHTLFGSRDPPFAPSTAVAMGPGLPATPSKGITLDGSLHNSLLSSSLFQGSRPFLLRNQTSQMTPFANSPATSSKLAVDPTLPAGAFDSSTAMSNSGSVGSYFLNVNTPSPAAFPILFSPGGLPLQPIAPPPLTPDYFNFASYKDDGREASYMTAATTSHDIPRFGLTSPSAGVLFTSSTAMPRRPPFATHIQSSGFQRPPSMLSDISASSGSASSSSTSVDLLGFSPETSPETLNAAATGVAEAKDAKHFLSQEDLLSLSPQQNLILHEAHQEAQRRAGLGAFVAASPDDFSSPEAAAEDIPAATVSALSPPAKLASSSTKTGQAVKADSTQSPSLRAKSVTLPAINTLQVSSPKAAKAQTLSPIQPSPAAFKVAAAIKPKQLGSFPADEAFAGSLDELKDVPADKKPPYLWWTLIRAAILGSPDGRMQMDALFAAILEKFPYFGTAKEAKNWKSSIRSVIHTKPCFCKSEDESGAVWWSVDVNIDPREQRRGMKKRSNSGEMKKPAELGMTMGAAARSRRESSQVFLEDPDEEEEDDIQSDAAAKDDDYDDNDSTDLGGDACGHRSGGKPRKRRKTN